MNGALAKLVCAWGALVRALSDGLSRLSSRSTTTIYVDGRSIRILTTDGSRVSGWDSVPVPDGLVEDGLIVDPSRVGSLIEALLDERKLSRKRVVVGLVGKGSVPRMLSLPVIAPKLLPEAIAYESEREMPLPLDDIYLCWHDLGTKDDERRLYVLGVPRPILDRGVEALALARINAPVIDLKLVALARAVNRSEAIIVDLGSDTTDIVFVAEGVPLMMRSLAFRGLLRGKGETDWDKVRHVAAELSRTVDFYNSTRPEFSISPESPVFLTGELSGDSDITGPLRAILSNPIEELDPSMECPAEFPVSEYAVNLGLALRGGGSRGKTRRVDHPALDIVIARDGRSETQPIVSRLLKPWVAALVVALLFPVYMVNRNGGDEVARLEEELVAIRQEAQAVDETTLPVSRIEAEADSLEEQRQAIIGKRANLADRLRLIFDVLPAGVHPSAINVSDDTITVDGLAATRSGALRYAELLEGTKPFSSVHIASLATGNSQEPAGGVAFTFTVDSE